MKKITVLFSVLLVLLFTSCFSEAESPLYDSEWLMTNYDQNGHEYYHKLVLTKDHNAVLTASYTDSTNIIQWTGTYKLSSKKIKFNFTECERFEGGEKKGNYKATKLIKYYTGDFIYSVSLIGETEEDKKYYLQLVRPETYFYGKGEDIFGNVLDVFEKIK